MPFNRKAEFLVVSPDLSADSEISYLVIWTSWAYFGDAVSDNRWTLRKQCVKTGAEPVRKVKLFFLTFPRIGWDGRGPTRMGPTCWPYPEFQYRRLRAEIWGNSDGLAIRVTDSGTSFYVIVLIRVTVLIIAWTAHSVDRGHCGQGTLWMVHMEKINVDYSKKDMRTPENMDTR